MRPEAVAIRPANGHEIELLHGIYNTSRAGISCYSGSEVDLATFARLIEGEETHIAFAAGIPAGFVSLWAADQFIHHLYVSPGHQSRGIGTALLAYCEQHYGAALSLKCDTENHQAQRFYRSKGWLARERGAGEFGQWERLYAPLE